MDLRTLQYVATAARLESITKASEQLNVAQPALSRKIRLLEEELGVVLLVRHARGVTATVEGRRVVELAETMLHLAKQIQDEAVSWSSELVGQVRVGFLPATGDLFVGDLVADFLRRHPKVTFVLQEGLTPDLSEALLSGRLDLAIMIYETKHQDLHRVPLFAEDIWLAGAPSIWPFGKGRVRVEQLADLPLVHAALASSALERIAVSHKRNFRSVIEGGSRSAARAAVRAGAGFTLMPASWVAEDIADGRLVGAPIEGVEVHRGLFWRIGRPQSRAVVRFVAEIESTVGGLKVTHPAIARDIAELSAGGATAGA